MLNTNAGKIGTILTIGACAVAGAVSTYQQDGQVDWNAVSTYGSMGAVVGGAVAGISYAATSVATGECVFHCFIEGTLVTTNLGYKPIEDIKVGDYVLSTNVENNTTEYKKVTHLFRNETTEWIHTVVNGEEILSTAGHPYYVQNKGWVRAKNLEIGDVLIDEYNKKVLVENVYIEKLTSPEVTYNFEVEDFHTYYVGENSILVHNKCSVNNTKTQELSKEIDVSKKTNFKCKDFAEDLKSKMNKNGIHGEKIEIKPNYGTAYIYSDSLKGSISTNGYHCGIQVDGIVYDNLHPNGIPFIEWINDLGGEGLFNIIRSIF